MPRNRPAQLRARLNGQEVPIASSDAIAIGRDPGSDIELKSDRASRRHARLSLEGDGWIVEDLGSLNGTFVNGQRVDRWPVMAPLSIRFGNPWQGDLLELSFSEGREPADAPDLGTLTSIRPAASVLRIGRADDNDIRLSDLTISRHHAVFRAERGGYGIEDLGSFNGTFLNGQRVAGTVALKDNDLIGIGRSSFRVVSGKLEEYVDTGEVSFDAVGISVRARDLTLVDDVSLALPPRSLLAVLGPSGAGKTTLLGALTGFRPARAGRVLYAGRDLYANYEHLRRRIGYVPQEDILHQQLDLRTALDYAAELRFPPDVSASERRSRVTEVMKELGLAERAGLPIHKLSGGQRKRTSVAVELLTKPSVLFLDEPTSGLDPGYEKAVMHLLRELATGGRTVVIVTHSLQSIDLCDRVLFLAPGGRTAYFGPPAGALTYFGRTSYSDVFVDLERDRAANWAERFRRDPSYARYIGTPLDQRASAPPAREEPRPPVPSHEWSRQLWTLVRRYLAVIVADRRNLALLLLQAPILGLLMLAVFSSDALTAIPNRHASTVLLTLALSATWLGASNSVREIVKERAIYLRERSVGLLPSAYVASKLVVLAMLTVIQAVVLANIGLAGQEGVGAADGGGVFAGDLVLNTAIAGIAGMTLGLLISGVVSSPDRALTVLPILLIAQLVLANPQFEIDRPPLRELSQLASAKWAFSANAATIDLRSLQDATCALGPSSQSGQCRVWSDGPDSWGRDVSVLVLLGVAGVTAAWLRLQRTSASFG